MVQKSGYNVIFIIEVNKSLSKRIIQEGYKSVRLANEKISVYCQEDGYICGMLFNYLIINTICNKVSLKKELKFIDGIISKNGSIEDPSLQFSLDLLSVEREEEKKKDNNSLVDLLSIEREEVKKKDNNSLVGLLSVEREEEKKKDNNSLVDLLSVEREEEKKKDNNSLVDLLSVEREEEKKKDNNSLVDLLSIEREEVKKKDNNSLVDLLSVEREEEKKKDNNSLVDSLSIEREEVKKKDNNSLEQVYTVTSLNTKAIEVVAAKLISLSRYISDSFGSLLLSASITIDIVNNMYLLLPDSYKNMNTKSSARDESQYNTNISQNISYKTSEIAKQVDDNSHYYPIENIKSCLKCNDQFFSLVKQNSIESSMSEDMNSILNKNERWKIYLNNNRSDIIQLLSYLADDNMFYDVESLKYPSLKSILKHNGVYNKFISYNQDEHKWYCIACLLYSEDPMLSGNKYIYTTVESHMSLSTHKIALKKFRSLLQNLKNNQTLISNSTNHCITTNNKLVWKYFLSKFYNCICVCLSHIHSIYGDTTTLSSTNCGMFLTLLKLTGKNDPIFNQFLIENERIYKSIRSIQKWISIISKSLIEILKNNVGNKLYSLTTDGTTAQKLEELTITIRYIDDNFKIHQYFLYILEETSPSGVFIAKSILKCLEQFNYIKSNLCCISYDNCICNTSITSGIIAGLSMNPSSIIGYGCRVHMLNLSLLDLQKSIIDSSFYIDTINNVATSWSRCSRIRVLIKNHGFSLYTLPQISDTRFIARYFSIYPYMIHSKQTLCKIFLLYYYSYNKNNICFKNCEQMLKVIGEVSFQLYIESWFYLLSIMHDASSQLQSDTLTVSEALRIINQTFDRLSNLCSPQTIKKMYKNAVNRRDYLYSNIQSLAQCLKKYSNIESKSCIDSIINIMNNMPNYINEFNIDIIENSANDLSYDDTNSSHDDFSESGEVLNSESLSNYDTSFPQQSSFSISESILSILNYREEMEKENLQRTYIYKGLQVPQTKRVKQNILINRDNDINMAPVAANEHSKDIRMNRCVSNINNTNSDKYIQFILLQETKQKSSSLSLPTSSSTSITSCPEKPIMNIYNILDEDIDIFYSILYSELSPLHNTNNSLKNIDNSNNSSKSKSNAPLLLSETKRSRGRPRKIQNCTRNSENIIKDIRSLYPDKKRIISTYNVDQIGTIESLSQETTSNTTLDEKKLYVKSKLDSSNYNIIFENNRNNIYQFSANINLMILRIKQSMITRLYKDIIKDLSLSLFVTPDLILRTSEDTQLLCIQTFYSLFSFRLPIDFVSKIGQMINYLKTIISLESSISDIIEMIRKKYQINYTMYEVAVQICLTVNPTSIKSETCFSTLRRIKSCFQTSMKPELLQAYMSSTCNQDLLSSLNSSEIVEKYMEDLRLPILSNNLTTKVLKSSLLNCD
ncbi:hypothetical protein WA158_006918 [Blastocystis sp. Blastoise]